ncbi:MAG: 2-oxoacid:acceptor oxidoreductase family protein [Dehalococcoidia bacterium]|nr:2-oxoacid:acceptor oxidoreductase family protein [Dehalococcoidia bacterium]
MSTENCSQSYPRYEIRIAGSGGQGILLAGIILAEAALLDRKYVAQTANYGPEARGGNSISEVVISDGEIDYPSALEVDLLVALSQEACDRNLAGVKEGGSVIVDSNLVPNVPWQTAACLPFGEIARKAGEKRAINMAALGAVASFCPAVSADSIIAVMAKRLPAAKVEINQQAFNEARQAADNLRAQSQAYQNQSEADA